MLYIVPTPIGNMEDITLRAIRILSEVDVIMAEDTRTSGRLLKHHDITTPLQSFHAHNEHGKLDYVMGQLKEGKDIALISDAGTPGISDPGFLLARSCMENEIKLSCLPGPTAVIPAIVMSGIPCDRFFFEGFLPHKKGKKTRIEYLLSLKETFAFYESPYRVVKSLKMIHELSSESRDVAVCREISKIYEECIYGTVEEVIEKLESKGQIKGEFVIVVQGKKGK